MRVVAAGFESDGSWQASYSLRSSWCYLTCSYSGSRRHCPSAIITAAMAGTGAMAEILHFIDQVAAVNAASLLNQWVQASQHHSGNNSAYCCYSRSRLMLRSRGRLSLDSSASTTVACAAVTSSRVTALACCWRPYHHHKTLCFVHLVLECFLAAWNIHQIHHVDINVA